ncbi:hypothetical protein D3C75_1073380 [compost metagenome]
MKLEISQLTPTKTEITPKAITAPTKTFLPLNLFISQPETGTAIARAKIYPVMAHWMVSNVVWKSFVS